MKSVSTRGHEGAILAQHQETLPATPKGGAGEPADGPTAF
jgi:hypothetical protein